MLNEGKVSQQHQRGHVRDAEWRSAGFPLTLNTSQCPLPSSKKQGKSKRQSQYKAKNTHHVGAAVSTCAIRSFGGSAQPEFQRA